MAVIRAALPADAGAIAAIEVETWRTAYAGILPDAMLLGLDPARRRQSWGRTVRYDPGDAVIATEDGGVVGFGSCGRQPLTALPYSGEIFTLYVLPDRQNQGTGRLLLAALFERLVGLGQTSALVWVLSDNPSRYFYERMGARWVANRPIPVWRGQSVDAAGYGWTDLRAVLERRGQMPSRIG
jgi:ribosomal protein S18 acetylase RimI-like enzyme